MRISAEDLEKSIKSFDDGPLFFNEDALLDLRDLRAAARAVVEIGYPVKTLTEQARLITSIDALRAALGREGE